MSGQIVFGDNLDYLRTVPNESIDLIYIDPPFNTGRTQIRKHLRTIRDDSAPDRKGFKGNGYRTEVVGQKAFQDTFSSFRDFIHPRLLEGYRVLKPNGSMFVHLDYREVHRCKLWLDDIFQNPQCFINEIVWAYDYGARSRTRWSPKHDNILWFAKDPADYTFNYDDIDRIPYMAPELVGPEKAAKGKTPTDMWWHTIVSPTGKEKTGYPTQKPLGIIERVVRVHSNPGETVLDFFAGSGTVGEACGKLGRKYVLVDSNPEAVAVMKRRLAPYSPNFTTIKPKQETGSPIVKNTGYNPLTYALGRWYYRATLELMWNGGKARTVTLDEITTLGPSAQGNHSKLSLSPWALVEDVKKNKYRRLTERGCKFMRGLLTVPSQIEQTADGKWQPVSGCQQISIADIPEQKGPSRKRKAAKH